MEEINKKIKTLRREVVRAFLLLSIPHLFVCILTSQVTTNPMSNIKWQLCWFLIYFTISLLVYVFAPKIIKRRQNGK